MAEPNWSNETMWTGDNLPIMRGMNSESVDLIYLDPPFNSKANYAAPIGSKAAGAEFKDTWTLRDIDVAWLDLIEQKHPKVNRVIQAAMIDSDKSYLIYMAARLIEMHRILKPTGSIYLHCDPTMGHYLKLLMDAVWGRRAFRTDISWKRISAHSDTKQGRRQHGRIHDVLLYYTASNKWTWNPVYTPYDQDYVDDFYRHTDDAGRRYQKGDLTAAKPGGDTQYEWRIKRREGGEWEADLSDEWMLPQAGWEYQGIPPYSGRYWAYSREKMSEFAVADRLAYAKTGMPRHKRYLDEMPGVPLQDVWTDIPFALGKQRTGYPTQKPLALLDRIIMASSDEDDMVLDPFCGCATACVAAHERNRKWTGIDVSPKAFELVKQRIVDQGGLFFNLIQRTDVPQRTDLGKLSKYNSTANKNRLYGEQGGYCAGCTTHFEPQHLTVDHIIARNSGGTDHIDNLQLLCGHCNAVKGDRGMEYLMAKLGA